MQTSNDEQMEGNYAFWTGGEIAVATTAMVTLLAAGIYAVLHGLRFDMLCVTALMGSLITMGAYDTRHNQPTLYNLLRTWPFGSSADDEVRGKRTVSSQALHGLFCMSICACLLLIAFKRP
jgi:hypothetical protein